MRLDAAPQGRETADHVVTQLERIYRDSAGLELEQLLDRHRHNARQEDYRQVKARLAQCYRTLREDHQYMDDALTVSVAESVKLLDEAQARDEALDSNTIQSIFMQSASMVHGKEDNVERHRNFSERKTKLFNFKGRSSEPIEAVCHEIEGWFNELIQDEKVLKFTELKVLSGVKDIVARHGVFQEKRDSLREVFLDIGVFVIPDKETPLLRQVYSIQLTAWATCKTSLGFIEKNRNGIIGEYRSCAYKPNRELIDGLSQNTRDEAKRKLREFLSCDA
ncbi:hypothetical protein EST38_g4594 [Candolleomyces aberdarensis]|uniref:Uncharacterized protein n=1 Tax=Candolleomyces aberdarensis TaxID=2316362 RepID=A0A4Q2DM84_9AGAR|nr:hypothetical protein EST38_g4594 [Candolleomyces aberdarensis]